MKEKGKGKVIIIGAGVGGLCTGIRLQKQGYEVSIYEKNHWAGGVVTRKYSKDRLFAWEESASILINPLTYDEIFEDIGKNPRDYYEMHILENSYKVFWENKTLLLSKDRQTLYQHIGQHFPKDVEGYKKFLERTVQKYKLSKEKVLNHSFYNIKQVVEIKLIGILLRLSPFTTASHYVKRYIKEPMLQAIILFQTFFMGISPYRLSNVYTTIAASAQEEGIGYIVGGVSAYVEALVKLFRELGGKIYYDHEVSQILMKDEKAQGIVCKGKKVYGDLVIVNGDYEYALKHLIGIKPSRYFRHSCSTFVIHLGLDKKYSELEVHNLYLHKQFKREVKSVFKGKLPRQPLLYIYAPSVQDASYCKKMNHSMINIMVRVPHLDAQEVVWNLDTQKKLYRICLEAVKNISGLEDIETHIIHKSVTLPTDFKKQYHYTKGSCFGIGHTFFQSICFRPQMVFEPFKNLYFVGTSIHPGNGISIVMMGAKLTAEKIK